MKHDYIALIYEGDKTEELLIKNIKKNFFLDIADFKIVTFPAGENIYMLYKQLKDDNFETDLIEIVREYNKQAKKVLEGVTRDEVSEIFLFFDYDGHNNNLGSKDPSGKDVISEMLDVFNDETDMGKLYINYPMVESIRDLQREDQCFRRCYVTLEQAKGYKNIVSDIHDFQDFRKYTKEDWKKLCLQAVRKASCIVKGDFNILKRKEYENCITQKSIFCNSIDKYVNNECIPILSSMPLFILEYFHDEFWNEMLSVGSE